MSGFINIGRANQPVSEQHNFSSALLRGLGSGDGLYMPYAIQPLADYAALLEQPFIDRSVQLLKHLIGNDVLSGQLEQIVEQAFDFPVPVKQLDQRTSVLELFHGPSLSFKDFGARFLAGCLQHCGQDRSVTVVTATSGDTGGAVARAFFGKPDTQVVVVYPQNGVTEQQARHFVGLGGNVISLAVDGSFDDCQRMVKQAFAEQDTFRTKLISANSINVARLLAQVCYYFELAAGLPLSVPLTVAIPSGNFGNATAAMIACALGLPLHRVLAVTNENDTVPRFLLNGDWQPHAVVRTITNAIDIAAPNNFRRIRYLQQQHAHLQPVFQAISIDQKTTRKAMRELAAEGYLVDPHTALAWAGVQQTLGDGEQAAVVATADPVKFSDEVEQITGIAVERDSTREQKGVLDRQQPIAPVYQNLSRILSQL